MEKLGYEDFINAINAGECRRVSSFSVELDDGTKATLDVTSGNDSGEKCAVLVVTDEEKLLMIGKHNEKFWAIVTSAIFEQFKMLYMNFKMAVMLSTAQEIKRNPVEELLDALKREG